LTPPSKTPDKSRESREGSTAALSRRLSGDLDVIVLKTLRKEPQRRYASVEQFAEDIRRHLEGLPVTARRDSWSYRAGKFAIRHKLAVSATALLLMVVLGGAAATVREARIAAANERRAEQRFNDVRKLANSLMFEIHDAIRDLPGSTPARRLLVTRALEYLDSLSAQSRGDASLQKELASAYERVGDVLGYPYAANLGDKTGAEASYRKALAIRESMAVANPKDVNAQRDLAGTYFRLAHVFESNGNFAGALASLDKAQPIARQLAAGNTDPILADQFAGVYYFTAATQAKTGDWSAAEENYRRSATIRDLALKANPDNLFLRTHLAADYAGLAECLEMKRDLSAAIEEQSKATAILEEGSKANPQNATLSEYLGEGINRLATYRREHGDVDVALKTYRRAHMIFADLLAADRKNSLAKANFGFSNNGIAHSLVALGKPLAAAVVFRESIATFQEMSPQTNSDRYPRSGLAEAFSGLGEAYSVLANGKHLPANEKRGYWQDALSSCQKGLALWNDKEKRGELDSEERQVSAAAAQCAAESEAQLGKLGVREVAAH